MRTSFLVFKILAVTALVLTVMVFVPVSSQAAVESEGNNALGITDLEIDGVPYDITFVFDTGINVYGDPGIFIFNDEESAFLASRAIQDALNEADVAITTVGPSNTNYFYLAAAEEPVDPGNPDSPQVYGAFESKYDVKTGGRPPDAWAPADNFPPFPLGVADPPLRTDSYTYAKAELADGSPPPDAIIGGSVTGLVGSGLVLQNNGIDDLPITEDGPFTFDKPLTAGTSYLVTVATQPSDPEQFCHVSKGRGNVRPEGVDDILVTCGDVPEPRVAEIIGVWTSGLWAYDAAGNFAQLWSNPPNEQIERNEDIAAGDFTGDGIADVAAIRLFEGQNRLGYIDGASSAWTFVPGSLPVRFTAGDVTGDGRSEIIGAYNSGIWYWDVAIKRFRKMSSDTTDKAIAAGDFTGDGIADVAAIFENGLWYIDGATLDWDKVPGRPPLNITAGDVTGDGLSEIIGTWDSGIWYRDVAAEKWTKMTSDGPTTDGEDIAAGDFTGDGIADVAAAFIAVPLEDVGLWYLDGATLAWTKLDDSYPYSLTAGDVNGK